MVDREKLRVVVVDDAPDAAQVMAQGLELHGYVPRYVPDATAALGLIQRWLPHVVVLDIDMPGIDGVELARHLRANYGRTMLLIAMTGWDRWHASVREVTKMVDHCLYKPGDLDELIRLIEAWRS